MTLDQCRKWLLAVWGTGFLVPFLLIVAQWGAGKYGDKFSEVLGWLTALTLPTILLMLGVMVANPTGDKSEDKMNEEKEEEKEEENGKDKKTGGSKTTRETTVFRVTLGASVLYLLIINVVFFFEPLWGSKPQELMRDSKIFLAVVDSIVSLLIGYFFGKK